MVNIISEEIARGEANPQPFAPYVAPNFHEHPWLPRQTAHVQALATWKAKNRGSRKQSIAFQMWLHHHYRFVFAAEMCHAWKPFGGIAAQLNHIAVILSLATLESANFAIRYHDLLASTFADFARARFSFDYHTALSEIHEDTRRAVARENASLSNTAPPVQGSPQRSGKGQNKGQQKGNKGKGKGGKGKKGGKRSKGDAQNTSGKGTTAPTPAPSVWSRVNM